MKSEELILQIQVIINQISYLERKKRFDFEGISLHPSEIHIMLETKGGLAVNATKISERLGITKGAVSQTLVRLEKKGIIEKTKDPYYKNELSIALTPLGKKVYDQYQIMSEQIISSFNSIFTQYSKEDLIVIQKFLAQIESSIKSI